MTLWIDATHKFCLDETPQIRSRIRADLEAITEILLEAVPQASVVLSGSLSHGEGRIGQDCLRMESDYDLYLIVPRLLHVQRMLGARSPFAQRLLSLELLTDLEIVVIWSPFLWRGMTHVDGILLAGDPIISRALEKPRFPHGDRTLCGAYASFLRAFREDDDQGFLQRAATLGFRAWLLGRATTGGSWQNEDLFSFRGNVAYLREHPGELAEPWREISEWALLAGLGNSSPQATVEPKIVLAFLKWVQGTFRLSAFRWAALLYMVHQVKRGRSFIRPHRLVSTYLTLASSLAELCLADGVSSIPGEIMRGIERLAGQSCPTPGRHRSKGLGAR